MEYVRQGNDKLFVGYYNCFNNNLVDIDQVISDGELSKLS